MATSRFTNTFFATRPRAGREADCHDGGHHLGCDAHAMASEKSSASIRGRDSATLKMKMNAVSTAATSNRKREKRDRPVSKRLALFLGQAGSNLSEGGAGSGSNHHAKGRALVDDRPHESASRLVQRLVVRVSATDLATGIDSPVSTPSSHSSSSTFSSGGRLARGRRREATPRRLAQGQSPGSGPFVRPQGLGLVSNLAAKGAIATSARYSLKKPRPTLRRRSPR